MALHDDSDLPQGVRESVLALKQLSQPDTSVDPFGQGDSPRANLSDTFGLASHPPSKEQVLAHKRYMDEYQALLPQGWQPPAAASPANPAPNFADVARPAGQPAMGLGSFPGAASHKGLEAQMDVTHPLLGPAGLPDVNAQALGQLRPTLVTPTVESPKVVAPTFAAPKRSF
jgi:hypothetical protein